MEKIRICCDGPVLNLKGVVANLDVGTQDNMQLGEECKSQKMCGNWARNW